MDASTSRAKRRFALAIAATLCFASTAHAQTARVNVGGLKAGEQYDRFIVQYRADAGVTQLAVARDRVQRSVAASPAAYAAGVPSVSHSMAPSGYVVRSSKPMNAVAADGWMRRLAEDNAIEYIEVDAKVSRLANPNDKWYASQLHLFGGFGVGADASWGMNQGDGVNVGVIDSGPTPHPDLDPALLPGYDFVDNDPHPALPECIEDGGTHGTMVAGTIAAVTNNNRGIASIAPKVRIVPARTATGCDRDHDVSWTSNIIRAIDWLSGGAVAGVPANPNLVEVINMSFGSRLACPAAMQAAINRAYERGVTLVVAAGNESLDTAGSQPANCNNVITVGSVDVMGRRNFWSNWGDPVDVAAPGNIYWPSIDDKVLIADQGTSFSAPMVSAIVALMQSAAAKPLTPARVELLLKASTKAFRWPQDKPLGTGIANAPAALSMAQAFLAPTFKGSYVMVARGLLPGQQAANGCLIVSENGNATRPSFYRWGAGGAPETCGLGNDDVLVANQQAVWDIAPVTHRNGVTAHIIRSRVNGQCLIRSNNGTDAMTSLYMWNDTADKRWCGLPNADVLIENGQAAWYFDTPVTQPGNGEIVLTAGLKQLRPSFAFLGFDPAGAPGETRYRNQKEWEFRFHPVPALPSGILVGAPYRFVSQLNAQCLDIRGGVSQGASLITWPCHSGANQKFVYQGQQLLVGGMCLDVRDAAQRNGAIVQAWPCHGGNNQRWAIEADGRIRSLMPGRAYCLDLHTDHDNHVRTYDCSAWKSHQQYTFHTF